jgi:5-methylcytosine-specific restriction protein A
MREEVILALELYLRSGTAGGQEHRDLSEYLRAWPIELELAQDPRFRNQSSVTSKIYNLQYLDTDGNYGRENGGAATEAVWEEFGRDEARVAIAAKTVRDSVALLAREPLSEPVTEQELEADESSVVIRAHRSRERNRRLVQEKRKRRLAETGALACEACGFDSAAAWGVPGITEVHHVKPVSKLAPGETTKLADLRLLCPNCHRLVHSSRDWLGWDDLLATVRG